MNRTFKKLLLINFLLVTLFSFAQAQNGIIRGTISDKATGEVLMFTNVVVQKTNPPLGAQTDLDGAYEISIEPGTYSLEVTYVGYSTSIIENVIVKAKEVTIVDFLMTDQSQELMTVVVQAERIERSEVAMLALQKKALNIQDGISSQEMSNFNAGNAAESMKRVTGTSVVDGKYIYVRGLGDRYSAAQLNGLQLPSTDPYRNSVQLDLIPSNLLDNIIASKTFSPDQPGNFTGGNVNIKTKSFPERFTVSASVTGSVNTQSSFVDDFLSYKGGKTDWLGYDDGTRALPSEVQDPAVRSQMIRSLRSRARSNEESANVLNTTSNAFNNTMAGTETSSPMNHGVSFSIGNQKMLGSNPLGFFAAVNYKRTYSHYNNGLFANWEVPGTDAPRLNEERNLRGTSSTDNPELGGMAGVSYKINGKHKLSLSTLYNHNGAKTATYQTGEFLSVLSGGVFETRAVAFRERSLSSTQLMGEHMLSAKGMKLEWGGSWIESAQNEPDLRFFANSYSNQNDGTRAYIIDPAEFDLPYHFFRTLKDQQVTSKVDLTIPLGEGKSYNKIQVGLAYSDKTRDFNEDRFQYDNSGDAAPKYNGLPTDWFASSNIGIVGQDANGRNNVGLFVTDQSIAANRYSGYERIGAAYVMGTYEFGKLKAIGGARVESTNMNVVSGDETKPEGNIDVYDVLPSLNLIYNLTEDQNLRFSASQTLARPNLRELAPFSAFEFIGDFIYSGNPNLQRTLAQNLDLRYEFYPRPGEMFAVSTFFKNFNNPIVQSFLPQATNPEVQYQNVDNAIVYGAEIEFRKNLDFISEKLRNFKFSTNLSYIYSKVDIQQDEVDIIMQINPEKGSTRPFQGQSPYIVNAALVYSNSERGWDATASFNVSGERLYFISKTAVPDIYEQPRPQLDLSISKRITSNITFKLGGANLLDRPFKTVMHFKGESYAIQQFRFGRVFSFGMSYQM